MESDCFVHESSDDRIQCNSSKLSKAVRIRKARESKAVQTKSFVAQS